MRRYTVVWSNSADRDLVNFWLTSHHPEEVQAGADYLEKLLGENPLGVGTNQSPLARTIEFGRVKLLYRVSEADRLVRILAVKEIPNTPW